MARAVVPMLHVPDVQQTAEWYRSIDFTIADTASDGEDVVWAYLTFGESAVMLSSGGQPSAAHRREVDLYIYVDDVDALYESIKARVDVVEPPHDTFYGMRELIIRDINRFWITFGQKAKPVS